MLLDNSSASLPGPRRKGPGEVVLDFILSGKHLLGPLAMRIRLRRRMPEMTLFHVPYRNIVWEFG